MAYLSKKRSKKCECGKHGECASLRCRCSCHSASLNAMVGSGIGIVVRKRDGVNSIALIS